MREKISLPVILVSALLVLHVMILSVNGPAAITWFLFAVSPFLLIWMVISVLRSDSYTGKELEDNDEWGYADKGKEDLGIF
jgi:hypothetical protein